MSALQVFMDRWGQHFEMYLENTQNELHGYTSYTKLRAEVCCLLSL